MADHTHIEWTDATWNPITGCSVVSAGCKHCYAMKLAGTRLAQHPSRAGLTVDTKAGPVWTGEVRFNEQWLDQPLRWRRPRRIFVCAHGDLFHEKVPIDWIYRVFEVMSRAPQHTFQVLTKRPERALNFFMHAALVGAAEGLRAVAAGRWPLPNVWLGVSVEDQAAADERIPLLLQCPAAVRWISAEPLLGPVELTRVYGVPHSAPFNALSDRTPQGNRRCVEHAPGYCMGDCAWRWPALDWVVAGGESGAGARPMHPDWARSLRDQCAAADVPFLFKQWGEWIPCDIENEGDGVRVYPIDDADDDGRFEGVRAPTCSAHRQDFWRVGKKLAGRHLDGVLHDNYPEVRHG